MRFPPPLWSHILEFGFIFPHNSEFLDLGRKLAHINELRNLNQTSKSDVVVYLRFRRYFGKSHFMRHGYDGIRMLSIAELRIKERMRNILNPEKKKIEYDDDYESGQSESSESADEGCYDEITAESDSDSEDGSSYSDDDICYGQQERLRKFILKLNNKG